MNIKNKVLFELTKKSLGYNKKFSGIHHGEGCYIFGNGASLKYFDLKNFDDQIAISCGSLFLHRDFNKINVKYYYEGHPFFYYPYWKNPYKGNIEINDYGAFHKSKVYSSENIEFFCSLSNFFGIRGKNIHYVHHFDKPFDGYLNSRLDKCFTSMASGLSGMLGLALYLGFTEITFVGYDYGFFPQSQGHFYEYGKFSDTRNPVPNNESRIVSAIETANLRVITPNENYQGHIVPSVSYKDYTGEDPYYRENYELCEDADLVAMDNCKMNYKIFPDTL